MDKLEHTFISSRHASATQELDETNMKSENAVLFIMSSNGSRPLET